ncbi:MAG: TrkH family potassium uptake protein [Eubacterium sp.]|nr:TrkH family potassium uptake protein [Eubacterium sp.]
MRIISHFSGNKERHLSTTKIIVMGFLITIVVGALLLMLPISTAEGLETSPIDALFTATTSVCVTGLVTLPTYSQWSIFGQVVILILIQVGGLGIITFTTIFLRILGRRIGLKERLLIQDAYNLDTMKGMVKLVQRVICGTFLVEGLGALSYMLVLVPDYGLRGIWMSVFNAVSAFCNAGMDIIGPNSLMDYATHPWMNLVTMGLIILGGLGFPVWWNILDTFHYDKVHYPSRREAFRHLRLHTKLVLFMTLVLIVLGALMILALEYNNPATLGKMSLWGKILASLFQSVTTRTAGFAGISQSGMREATSFICCILMFIGGSPSGTAGGIKTTTVAVLTLTVYSIIKGRRDTEIFERKISSDNVRKALSVFMVSFLAMLISVMLLSAVQEEPFMDCFYESVSAIATVGLSRDMTANLNELGKIIIIVTMYLGRIGPISLALFFNAKKFPNLKKYKTENISIG